MTTSPRASEPQAPSECPVCNKPIASTWKSGSGLSDFVRYECGLEMHNKAMVKEWRVEWSCNVHRQEWGIVMSTLRAERDAIEFAAHMPAEYEHGLASWINQHLYANYIGAKISQPITDLIESGRLTFPNAPVYAERDAALARAEQAEAELERNSNLGVCTWCGETQPRENIAEHIVDCIKHPMGELARKFETARDVLVAENAALTARVGELQVAGQESLVPIAALILETGTHKYLHTSLIWQFKKAHDLLLAALSPARESDVRK